MKRILALALIAGALVLGGCGRQHAAPPAGASTGDRPPAAATAGANSPAPAASDDVGALLNDVDHQLSNDDRPAADQD